MKTIVWLASYPKSGNTWFRALLANYYMRAGEDPVDINRLGGGPIASALAVFDENAGVAASDLTGSEVVRLRPQVYRQISEHFGDFHFMKVHDAYTYGPKDEPMFPPEATRGAIYLLRNPLDVAISYAHHNDTPVQRSVELMANPRHQLSARTGGWPSQLSQRLQTWSEHVTSWVDAPDIDVHVVRYEDLKSSPHATFLEAVRFAGLPIDEERVSQAIELSSFERLQSQEQDGGFGEKPLRAKSFFRKGKVGDWREMLTREQWEKITQDHADVMRRFGYWETSQWEVPP